MEKFIPRQETKNTDVFAQELSKTERGKQLLSAFGDVAKGIAFIPLTIFSAGAGAGINISFFERAVAKVKATNNGEQFDGKDNSKGFNYYLNN